MATASSSMSERYRVRINKEALVFSAAHFITFNGDVCERLHGHNYRVAVEVAGPLDENHYVVDFVALTERLRSIAAELDHRVMLPTEHPTICVTAGEHEVEVRLAERRWLFPRGDCVLLPVANTTAELVARHIGLKLIEGLDSLASTKLTSVRVEVDECFGQLAICELDVP